jgi:hypothetical protein
LVVDDGIVLKIDLFQLKTVFFSKNGNWKNLFEKKKNQQLEI